MNNIFPKKQYGFIICALFILWMVCSLYHCDEVGENEYTDLKGYWSFTIIQGENGFTGTFAIHAQDDNNFWGSGNVNLPGGGIQGFTISGGINKNDEVEMYWYGADVEVYNSEYKDNSIQGLCSGLGVAGADFVANRRE